MDKKKLKLSISGNTKKTISNIEQAKSNPKNSVIINNNKTFQKKKFYKSGSSTDNYKKPSFNLGTKKTVLIKAIIHFKNDIKLNENPLIEHCTIL